MIAIYEEINKVKESYKKEYGINISDERAFTALISSIYFYHDKDFRENIYSINDSIVDGSSDGGIDIVFFDDEQMKVIVVQTKFTENVDNNTIISELNKINSTIRNFEEGNYSTYNKSLKTQLTNALNSLNDEDKGNVEYWFVTISDLDESSIIRKIENDIREYNPEMVVIKQKTDLINRINNLRDDFNYVKFDKIDYDKDSGILNYESNDNKGIIVNISSKSLKDLFNAHQDKGLFDLNIRRYIANKTIDSGILKTIKDTPEDFWFLNNGITIACRYYEIDGNKIKLNDFSIVNGGQTTKLIGDSKFTKVPFLVTCKIISDSNGEDINGDFYTRVAEATNSQKPILPRDLKANRREMRSLKNWLSNEKINLEIKRGEKSVKTHYKIKNDELGQILLSFVNQRPGTARSGKKLIFDNNSLYNTIFNINYEKEPKRTFLLDLIDFNRRLEILSDNLIKGKSNKSITSEQKIILKNGKQILIALFGLMYRLSADESYAKKIHEDLSKLHTDNFEYRPIFSNYKLDDLDENILELIIFCIEILEDSWERVKDRETSISNYFKTDKKYIESIVKTFLSIYNSKLGKARTEEPLKIFKGIENDN